MSREQIASEMLARAECLPGGCDWSEAVAAELRAWAAALSQPQAASTQALRNAYEGAREDLLDWKGRALRAESTLRSLGYTGITPDIPPASSMTPVSTGAVDDAMAERAMSAYRLSRGTYAGEPAADAEDMRAALEAALAQPQAASSTQAGDWQAKARDMLARLETMQPPNVVLQQITMLGEARDILREALAASSTTPGSTGAGEWGSAAGVVDFWKNDPFEAAMAASSTTPGSTGVVDEAMVDAFWNAYIDAGRGGGIVNYRDVRRLLEAALAQPAQQATLPEITEESVIALVAGPYNWHHKMTEREEAEAKAFDRCRENTIGRIRVFFQTRRAMQSQPAQQGEQ